MTISKMYGTAVKKRLNAAGIIVPPVPRKDFWTDPNHFNLEEDPLIVSVDTSQTKEISPFFELVGMENEK